MRKNILSALLLLAAFVCTSTMANEPPTDISLDGKWSMEIQGKTYDVNVPHTYNIMEGLEDYAGEAVCRRMLPEIGDLKDINARYNFEVLRPNGFSVIKY